ncbi:Metallo-dependent phosphatase [Massarina eburnea CBS 473.64]|uniref:Metallo-dependent phosphatase n=1 Tax=Massarina eburnea CBS 473.64 TaxID=1395130 RepID=A0A6A6RRY2_9PLEO|nr:Metallo-dependent phosphatase [Massarina eburnea CBS 473.64]
MAPSFRNVFTRAFYSSPWNSSASSYLPLSSQEPISVSLFSFAVSLFASVSPRRKIILVSAFIIGVTLSTIMKWEHVVWLFTAKAGASPILGWEQGSTFDYPGLRFDYDRKFQITMFSDLHFGDGDKKPDTDGKTIGAMYSILDTEPGTDLVVLNGDLISCEWQDQTSANGLLDMIIDPFLKRNLPFTATFGNHDMSRTCNTRFMADHMWAKANNNGRQLTWTSNWVPGEYDDVGASNYYIPIYSSSGGGNPELKMLLWFFDSKGGTKYHPENEWQSEPNADWVDEKVVSWFKLTRDQIRADHGGKIFPSLAFVHIPPSVTEAFRKSGLRTKTTEPGLNEEIISVQADNTPFGDLPFLSALLETEGLMATFSGHDHKIDWCMKFSSAKPVTGYDTPAANGMNFCFGRKSGYGGYSDFERGSRHITIEEDMLGQNIIDTYIRLESGRISGHVTLNSTYGQDQYPAALKRSVTKAGDTDVGEKLKSASTSKRTSKPKGTTMKNTGSKTNTAKTTMTPKVTPTPKPQTNPTLITLVKPKPHYVSQLHRR